ncbi:MAG: hypothetical protein JNK78_18830 [Planctomycetes bacterium]|nr:hypothetical protein [Planctomycetota bacterium]
MKRRSEHLVLKRDGRTEFLRATKLARSVHSALHSVGVDEDWRALEVANVVLEALRQKRAGGSQGKDAVVLTTADIADAVQHLLVVTGQPQAAVAYGAVAAERTRRRRSLATLGRFVPGPVGVPVTGGDAAPPHARFRASDPE